MGIFKENASYEDVLSNISKVKDELNAVAEFLEAHPKVENNTILNKVNGKISSAKKDIESSLDLLKRVDF